MISTGNKKVIYVQHGKPIMHNGKYAQQPRYDDMMSDSNLYTVVKNSLFIHLIALHCKSSFFLIQQELIISLGMRI